MTLIGPLYTWGPDHLGWILWIVVPGALLPALLIVLITEAFSLRKALTYAVGGALTGIQAFR